jgi:hypothetical protein
VAARDAICPDSYAHTKRFLTPRAKGFCDDMTEQRHTNLPFRSSSSWQLLGRENATTVTRRSSGMSTGRTPVAAYPHAITLIEKKTIMDTPKQTALHAVLVATLEKEAISATKNGA